MRRHSRIIDTLYFADTAFGFAMLAFVLASGLSKRLRDTLSLLLEGHSEKQVATALGLGNAA